MRLALDSRPSAAVTLLIAAVVVACSTDAAGNAPSTSASAGLPAPRNASFDGGGAGYDSGAQVLAYSTALPPAEAARDYAATLTAQGYVAIGVDGAWQYFRSGDAVVAFEVGASGPPTDLLVRVMELDATVLLDLRPVTGGPEAGVALRSLVPQPDPPSGKPKNGNGNGVAGTPGTGNGNAGGSGNGNAGGNGNGNGEPGATADPGNGGNAGVNGNANAGNNSNAGGNGNGNAGGNGNGNGNTEASPQPTDNGNTGGNGNGNAGGNGNGNAGGNGNGNGGGNGS